jgi:glutamyl-tRNA reductase
MHHLIIVHRAYQDAGEINQSALPSWPLNTKVWRTCRREIAFFSSNQPSVMNLSSFDEMYFDYDAEEFLVQVLCGLKSPLVGETEVFGQFKLWWSQLPQDEFKIKLEAKVQKIYSVVKKVREESLYGLGSQSYGSLFRKKINQLKLENKLKSAELKIDIIGSGQLVLEILPWIQKEHLYRLWVRDVNKTIETGRFTNAFSILELDKIKPEPLNVLIVAAPISHSQLDSIIENNFSLNLFDFRSDSMNFKSRTELASHLNLNDFTLVVDGAKKAIKSQIENAQNIILRWKKDELNKVQIRPFGWDDLCC